jgi:hypothetical protein
MLGGCASSTCAKKTCSFLFFLNSFVLLTQELHAFGMWWQYHSKIPLIQYISTKNQAYKLLYACDFLVTINTFHVDLWLVMETIMVRIANVVGVVSSMDLG